MWHPRGNSQINTYMQDTKRMLLLTGKIFSHWKLPAIIIADEITKTPQNWYWILYFHFSFLFKTQDHWNSSSPQGVFPKELAPLSPNLTAATNCVVTEQIVILDLSMQQFKNFHSSVHLGFTYYVLDRKGNNMMKQP